MKTKWWLAVAGLVALAAGCGKSEQPAAVTQQQTGTARLASEVGQNVQDDLDHVAAEFDGAVRNAADETAAQIEQQRNDLAEFAAQMAEDAKDRALDMPAVLINEFFGTGGQGRRDAQRRRRPSGERTARP